MASRAELAARLRHGQTVGIIPDGINGIFARRKGRDDGPARDAVVVEVDVAVTQTVTKVDSKQKLSDEVVSMINETLNSEETDSDTPAVRSRQFADFQSDAPACDNCGAITARNGNCYLCHNCGNSMGCS